MQRPRLRPFMYLSNKNIPYLQSALFLHQPCCSAACALLLVSSLQLPTPSLSMATELESVEPQSLKKLSFKSLKRALDLFSPVHAQFPPPDAKIKKIRISHKVNVAYGGTKSTTNQPPCQVNSATQDHRQQPGPSNTLALPGPADSKNPQKEGPQNALVVGPAMPSIAPHGLGFPSKSIVVASGSGSSEWNLSTSALMERMPSKWPRPVWHAPWKNYRVVSGHLGCVRSIAVDPSNTWFCTGSADRTIKIWDLANGTLKLTLTGHIGQIRGLAISNRHTYMFSAGDDKQVKCWDLEQNKVIRSYHGHLSGVYCLALHPTLDILLTGGRDSVCRVWDIRSKMHIHALSGHTSTVCSVFTRPTDPQVITGSHDRSIKMWDLRNGGTLLTTLTNHEKSVRAMAPHPKEQSFASASADGNIIKFNLPNGDFSHNMPSQQKTIINAMALNEDGVMVTGGDNGSLGFWDWKSGHNFQQAQTIVQPGSLDSEAGIYALTYDVTGTRLITCEADKTIKLWKEDENATPETFPLKFRPPKDIRRF